MPKVKQRRGDLNLEEIKVHEIPRICRWLLRVLLITAYLHLDYVVDAYFD